MDTRNRTTSLDVAKCLAAFLVVAIHADFPGMFGKYVNAWARIAGPLFFIISGYYYPKSVIRRAESVFDWESEAFVHLVRFCPHLAPRYAST